MKRLMPKLSVLLVILALAPLAPAGVSTDYIIVQFQDPPAASYEGGLAGLERTKPLKGKFNAKTPAARAYLAHLDKVHGNYKKWLAQNAPAAKVVRDLKVTLNAIAIELNGVAAEKAAGGPDKKAWAYSAIYRPSMNVSTGLIGAPALWGASRADAGAGIVVGVIDSGIEDRHPFFACKTIHHHGPYFSGIPVGINIVNTHGTHVAGTVGGCVCQLETCDPDGGPVHGPISGVAPGVTLHDFNVFPGRGALYYNQDGGAFSHDIAAAIEDAVNLPVDVINMSLGGTVQGPNDFLAQVSDAAVDAGVVVVAAAGNSGPGDMTAESPGTGRNVIAAGMASNPHFVGIPVTVGGTTYGAALGDFNNFGTVTASYTVTTPPNGCGSISDDLTGKLALIDRGVCTFSEKIRNAQTAGALGVLVVNNRAGDPTSMGQDGTPNQPTIPAAMLSRDDGNAIKPSGTATVDGTTPTEFITANADILQLDSSRGPAPFTYNIKPDVTAPGDNVYSSVFNFGPGGFNDVTFDFEFFRGTSMATPHVAGSAALLLAAHPDWTPADVRSALVNSAARVVTDPLTASFDPGVMSRGGGRIDLPAATAVPVTFNPASVSFGLRKGNKAANDSATVEVRNVSGATQSCTVTVTGPPIVNASPSALTLAAGESATITVDLNAGKASVTGSGDYEGDVIVVCGATELRVPWFVRIDRKAKVAAAKR
jgi:minor extracellular serine protease Vpr